MSDPIRDAISDIDRAEADLREAVQSMNATIKVSDYMPASKLVVARAMAWEKANTAYFAALYRKNGGAA